jgi:hypothetical protein
MRERVIECVILDEYQCAEAVADLRRSMSCENNQCGAALQYYIREFAYMPHSMIAKVMNRKPWHVRQTLDRMREAAEATRVPTSLNGSYREFIEQIDDYFRSKYGFKNVELSSLTNSSEQDYLLWEAQKKTNHYDSNSESHTQYEVAEMVCAFFGVDSTEEVLDGLVENFYMEYNGVQ